MTRRIGLPKAFKFIQEPALFRSPKLPVPDQFSPRGRWQSGPLHTFTDDYRQEFFWRRPQEGLIVALAAGTVTAPDFTVWLDDPAPWAQHQAWRSALVAQLWQDHGVDVLPVVSFGSGVARWVRPGSTWAIRVCSGKNEAWRSELLKFVDEAQPGLIVAFGNDPYFDFGVPTVSRRLVSRLVDAAQKEGRR